MTEAEYNRSEGIRRSDLWKLKKSPKHFRYELEHPSEPTPAMVFGAAVHCAVLEDAETFDSLYWVEDVNARTKEGKQRKAEMAEAGYTMLSTEQFRAIAGIKESLESNPLVKRLLSGQHETPYFWEDDITGEPCKCRTDCELDVNGQHIIVDLKTCADASTEAFMRDAVKLGYHVQAAMYCEGVKAVTGKDSIFVFVTIEKDAPYAINILQADEAFLLYGTDEYRYLMGLYHDCKTKDEWPGYSGTNGINTLELPAWLKRGVE